MADEIVPPATQLAAVSLENDGSTVQRAQFSNRVLIRTILDRPDGGAGLAGQTVRIGGWVKSGRDQGKRTFSFLAVNDGSCPANLQVMVDPSLYDVSNLVATGTCVTVDGVLKVPPKGKGTQQQIELNVVKVIDVGTVDASKYPLPKTKLTLETLRDVLHLRSRTNSISAVARIRNALAFATHSFFQEHSFLYIHTPIITTSDCEGAGEMFQATTLINYTERLEQDLIDNPPPTEADVEAARLIVIERGNVVAELKAAKASKEAITAAVAELKIAKETFAHIDERSRLRPGLPKKDGNIDYSKDFFGRQAFLTVSGQLQVETYACALSNVYTFGPTFRAENSHTSRHLAEFWMVEPEIAFADLEDDMNCAEAYVKYMCNWLLEKCYADMELMAKNFDSGCIDRLKLVASTPFGRITYTKAIELLEEAVAKGKEFDNNVEWGIDLASEHERYLTEVLFQKPLIVYNYPKGIKAFYMRLNDDEKTVAAMDVLVPKVGELIGGSQREERYDVIKKRIEEMGLPIEPYEWYLDLRRYGTVKHCGFGLGFERMILFATGLDNIRDVIPFPRYPGKADL
ncbi:SYNC1 protein [Arabidopsis thaliana]|jgi:asparaginyl-tRNA synthetase|uniref:Asparagine--tRNA ligase, cytoplasmic 1 n=3 Tax=Arabidopsis TaxID=3701 RepID=SYNC1_ARATH|nr:Class II aminoacyl-tRNA and biotin synthetases superfamily protein [Arabidopsis thaliana]Q9SW96.1 RecName: Full=Asparagine--tRNA ligase, cytoplasmic 1; AltName: Full=Asparaginyl-tRNA synthetase 1; Short=AsnRS 1; AltName: Full=Protein EMBRYO DEFECTIVE 2755 [Arabidopsis thaliana]KAG7613242.1 OB-fold nucleic acid binding domain AA-tRNA synthetase-type [Arabidopsis suecica]AAD46681.1 SYNC1 protein [Arabidopsis thaliana]ABO38771.1 At5g56680 [Arabidopsis thaliana]AED96795.1 Class II aminoacyl-tRN|eukprot:NP_200479.1 Class II aminoacyl-tRNA and biotin synthetases superfamily protein [Arabidopsis thaliana]